MDEYEVREKAGRAWADWKDSDLPPLTPAMLRAELEKPIEDDDPIEWMTWEDIKAKVAELGPLRWIVPDMIMKRGLHFISATSGGGKSWAALDLLRATMVGGIWLGSIECEKAKVMYIDEEMGCQVFLDRADQLGIPQKNIIYADHQRIKLDNPKYLHSILRKIEELQIDIVIVDTLVRVHGLDENSNTEMSRLYGYFCEMKNLGAAVVVLHHNRKSGSESGIGHEQMRGAGDIVSQADTVFSISHKLETDTYTLVTTKNRHWRKKEKQPAVSWTIGAQDGILKLIHAEPEGYAARVGQSTTDAVLACVEANPGVGKNIIHAKVGGRKETILTVIDELVAENLLHAEPSLRGGFRYTKKA
jgi:RecA-family ATPase